MANSYKILRPNGTVKCWVKLQEFRRLILDGQVKQIAVRVAQYIK